MYKAYSIVALIAAFVPALVGAEVSGRAEIEFFGEQKVIEVQDGYAFTAPDLFDESKLATIVILSDTPIDKAPLVSERDRDSAISSQLRGTNANYMEIRVSQESGLQSINYIFSRAGNLSKSGTDLGKLTRTDGKHIAGSLNNSTVFFDLPIAAPPKLPVLATLSIHVSTGSDDGRLCRPLVIMMKPAEDRDRDDLSAALGDRPRSGGRYPLTQPLMRPGTIAASQGERSEGW